MEHIDKEWLETVMDLMAQIVATVYSNEKKVKKEQEDR